MPRLEGMTVESPYAAQLDTIPVDHRKTSILGSETHYWVYGPDDAAETIVVVHGYRGEHHGIEPVVAHLPEFRMIVADLPGFGESSPLTEHPHSIAGYVAWLEAFTTDLGLRGTATILGHSFGTIVTSAAVAAGLPTPGLILINPIAMPGDKGPHPIMSGVTVKYYRAAAKLPKKLGYALLNNWLLVQLMSVALVKTKDKALRKWIHREHHTFFNRFHDRDSVVEGFEASISADVSQFAPDIACPTLLIAAELDDITPVSAQYDLQRTFPDARLRVLGAVGHLIHYEVPDQAADAIRDFLGVTPTS